MTVKGSTFTSADGLRGSVFEVCGCSWKSVVISRDGKAVQALGHTALAAKRLALRKARALCVFGRKGANDEKL